MCESLQIVYKFYNDKYKTIAVCNVGTSWGYRKFNIMLINNIFAMFGSSMRGSSVEI